MSTTMSEGVDMETTTPPEIPPEIPPVDTPPVDTTLTGNGSADVNALFGDATSDSDSDSEVDTPPTTGSSSSMPPPPPRSLSPLTLKNYPKLPPTSTVSYMRFPNVVGVQPAEYSEDYYDSDDEKQTFPHTVSVIRWKNAEGRTEDGKRKRESNTRVVKWDDGSLTLHVGAEVFELTQTPSPHTYLTLVQPCPSGTLLESVSSVPHKLTARPATLESSAHKDLARSLRRRTLKKSRGVAVTTTTSDPEAAKSARARAADDVAAHKRRKAYSGGNAPRGQRMDAGYLEGGDLGEIKRRAIAGDDVDFGTDDDSSGEEEMKDSDEE
eukprot:CAMPEP_0182454300 /NCGR_PEP_ID=MMETSP1319-20130603/999_1 /TAXON_ID=172717 /ORGANISM="Bolidomonas pacifica, Strain RCC208" /LENGTH=323 /DNA_ID=CAMNT_0024652303 /DNA_START=493 /DNA_END=1461 /DNA_ORIENTATION=-